MPELYAVAVDGDAAEHDEVDRLHVLDADGAGHGRGHMAGRGLVWRHGELSWVEQPVARRSVTPR